MLDHRVYRAAFVPALVALFVVAFSLADPPAPQTTRLAPEAFDAARAFGRAEPPPRNSVRELAATFPARRPGSPGDAALADRVASVFAATGFAGPGGVRREAHDADTIDGRRTVEDVVAVRQGLSSRAVVVLAHRDAPAGPAAADLSGTAVLLELARLLADRDLGRTVVLASVSGGSGGFEGARRVAERLDADVDAVLVLGDLASAVVRRPFVIGWANGRGPAPYGLQRTAQVALRRELAGEPGRDRATVQWLRRAFPVTLGEQGAVGAAGLPAILISASGERRPAADAEIRERRMTTFGRGVLRTLTATLDAVGVEPGDEGASGAFAGREGIVTMGRLVPEWGVRLLVAAWLLPALLAAFDAFFRARRRGRPVGRWLLWTASLGLPVLLAWAWARTLDLVGVLSTLPAPTAPELVPLGAAGIVGLVSVAFVLVAAALLLRPRLVRRLRLADDASSGGAAAAAGLGLAALVAGVWVTNAYAAGVLLPAAHLWLLASAGPRPPRRSVAALAVAAGLVAPAAVWSYHLHAWGIGPLEGTWTAFGIAAGGVLGALDAVVLTGVFAALCATVAVVRARRPAAPAAEAPAERLVTRGPGTYAGPGSLGGTESALRR